MRETRSTAESKNFAREMPVPPEIMEHRQSHKPTPEAIAMHEAWKAQVVENNQRAAAEALELNRRIVAGEYEPDPKNDARVMKRPDLKKPTGLAGWFNRLIGRN